MKPSLIELLESIVWRERSPQLRHFEGLDAKSGIVVGLAGVLVAIGGERLGAAGQLGQGASALAVLLALWSFVPRGYPRLDLRGMRS